MDFTVEDLIRGKEFELAVGTHKIGIFMSQCSMSAALI